MLLIRPIQTKKKESPFTSLKMETGETCTLSLQNKLVSVFLPTSIQDPLYSSQGKVFCLNLENLGSKHTQIESSLFSFFFKRTWGRMSFCTCVCLSARRRKRRRWGWRKINCKLNWIMNSEKLDLFILPGLKLEAVRISEISGKLKRASKGGKFHLVQRLTWWDAAGIWWNMNDVYIASLLLRWLVRHRHSLFREIVTPLTTCQRG